MKKTIDSLRQSINGLDNEILELLVRRGKFSKEIGQLKNKEGYQIYSSSREREILDRLISSKINPLSSEDVESIFQEIFNVSKRMQGKLKVAFLGPQATFTHQLAIKHFGQGAEMSPQKSISEVFVEVEKGRADYGVVPIENSTEGVVNHTLDMFVESDLVICAEREEAISHYLLSPSGQISKIERVYSHPQALAQCRKWIESHLAKAEVHESASTADAACQASLDAGAAAIASALAGKLYHLEVVAPHIEDYAENYTRFLIVGKNSTPPSGKDKTSILLSIKDKVGALNNILEVFKNFKLNLTKIESRPTKKKAWEYIFFVDFLGHSEELQVQKALSALEKNCVYLKVLGSYPRGE